MRKGRGGEEEQEEEEEGKDLSGGRQWNASGSLSKTAASAEEGEVPCSASLHQWGPQIY